jgi:hypothetical protein
MTETPEVPRAGRSFFPSSRSATCPDEEDRIGSPMTGSTFPACHAGRPNPTAATPRPPMRLRRWLFRSVAPNAPADPASHPGSSRTPRSGPGSPLQAPTRRRMSLRLRPVPGGYARPPPPPRPKLLARRWKASIMHRRPVRPAGSGSRKICTASSCCPPGSQRTGPFRFGSMPPKIRLRIFEKEQGLHPER